MRKTRPLCFVCICFLLAQAVLLIVNGGEGSLNVPASSIFYEEKETSVYIQGQVYQKADKSKVQVLYLRNNSVSDSNIMVYDKKFSEVAIGQYVSVRGTTGCFDEARNPGNFDQKKFYAKQRLYGVIWCEELCVLSGEADGWKEQLYQLKMQWEKVIYDTMGEENGAVMAAMLLGEKSDMDQEVKELYQKNGIGHILAISGLHISFIGLGLYQLLRKMGLGYGVSGLCAVFLLSLYGCMIGFGVSVFRAYVMLLFRVGAEVTGRVYDMLTALMVAAAITVGRQPLYLTDAGFLLSYGAILGILLVLPELEKLFCCRYKVFSSLYASVAVNLMLLPILLYFYYEFPVYSIFFNLLVIPLMSVVLGAGMIGSLLVMAGIPIGSVGLQVCSWILNLFEGLSRFGSRLPFARLVTGQPEVWKLVLYYLLLGTGLYLVHRDRKGKGRTLRLAFAVLCGILFVLISYRPHSGVQVTMMDVGQGDGIFIRGPKGGIYLIDGGSSDVKQLGKYRLEPFLKSQGAGALDYVFLTHGDSDHYSGVLELLQRQDVGVKIKCLVLPVHWKSEEALKEVADEAMAQGVSVAVMQSGNQIEEGNFSISCVQPTDEDEQLKGNEGSLVLSVTYEDFSMLCTGDVEGAGEQALTKRLQGKRYTVLKVAHHGSKNSGAETFLDVVSPKIALISAGEDNSYGHPHPETLKRLKEAGSRIYETAKSGAITLQTNGNTLTIDCFLY